MSQNKNPPKGLSEDELIFLHFLAKIYVQSIVKKAETECPQSFIRQRLIT